MLSQAGVTDTYSQLQINIALNVWCFACAVVGTLLADKIGRKPLGIGSLTFALIFLYLVGIFTKRKKSQCLMNQADRIFSVWFFD